MNTKQFEDYLLKHQGDSYKQLMDATGRSHKGIQKAFRRLGIGSRITYKGATPMQSRIGESAPQDNTKSGIEVRQDGAIVINWTNKTLITDLGQWGTFVTSFNTHGAIQRAYSNEYEGKGDTQSQIARRFDFPHAKAFALYAKIHGYTKSDLGQTDLEFEQGLTVEQAVEENIQALKRKAMKATEVAKWKRTQSDADKWNHFEHSVILPMRDWVSVHLPKFRAKPLNLPKSKDRFAGVVGISDWHYMKLCFDAQGREVYNREIAIAKLMEANDTMVAKMVKFGAPEKLYVVVGTDNLHIDNPSAKTTKFTEQAGQTDGNWEMELDNYVQVVIGMIDRYAQIAPVDVISIPGNHDKHTSIMLRVLLTMYYKGSKRVTVKREVERRVYRQYGTSCLIFTHGDDMSTAKLQGNVHKFIMAEARDHGINVATCENFVLYSGHLHTKQMDKLGSKSGGSKDLGIVQHVIFPSLSGEDTWHKENGYVGNKQEALLDIIDHVKGRSLTIYS